MVYRNIIRLFDERKRKLGILLQDDTVQLTSERTYQIRGAMDEIELMVMTLKQHRDVRVHNNFYQPPKVTEQKSIVQRFSRVFKKKPATQAFTLGEK